MSEGTTPHSVTAPGMPAGATVIESGVNDGAAKAQQSSGPAFVSPTDGMTESQAAAMKFVDASRAELARNPDNVWLVKKNREALGHALHGDAAPAWLQVSEDGAAPAKADATPIKDAPDTPLEKAMHGAMAPMPPEELAHYRTAGVNLGLHPAVSETMAHLAGEYGIPRAVANDLQTVAASHFKGLDSIPVLNDAEQADFAQAAIDKYGADVIGDLTTQARQVLQDKGLLEHFDKLGLTSSTMAFDRRVLRSIVFWGKAGKK